MKKYLLLAVSLGLFLPVLAQPTPGRIRYEVTTRLDLSKFMRRTDGGEPLKPGSPGYPTNLPDVITRGLTLTFGPAYAREEDEGPTVQILSAGTESRAERPMSQRALAVSALKPTFTETTYANLAARTQVLVLTMATGKDADKPATRYRTEQPYTTPADWRETGRRKTIAGLSCREAKATLKGVAYTAWFTTDLPFTYSPEREIAPPRGVVLLLESQQKQYRATKLMAQAVGEADVLPPADAEFLSPTEFDNVRNCADADFLRHLSEKVNAE